MLKYLSLAELSKPVNIYEYTARNNETRTNNPKFPKVQVFLSHRHTEPAQLIEKVRGFFSTYGADLYLDWLDKGMPQVTNAETARRLKDKITDSSKFVILATPESIESIWIPWEIGLADRIKGLDCIAILPIVQDENQWDQREYYKLYKKIVCINSTWQVAEPDNNVTGITLSTWLRS
jgi:hypothetical protein